MRYDVIIFDLDGVITTERIYWDCARLTLWEVFGSGSDEKTLADAVHHVSVRNMILPDELIFAVKNRAVNSNWDLTHIAACALIAQMPDFGSANDNTLETVLQMAAASSLGAAAMPAVMTELLMTAERHQGVDLLQAAAEMASRNVPGPDALFAPGGPLWQHLFHLFQGWYDGSRMRQWGAEPLPEVPVLAPDVIAVVLGELQTKGVKLAVATGRPRAEAVAPLSNFSVLKYFEPERMITYDFVEAAERTTGQSGLGKPHPYMVRKAAYPELPDAQLIAGSAPVLDSRILVVGDSRSDVLAARAAGADCLGVLSGVSGPQARQERRQAMLDAGCCDVLDDISSLPEWLNKPDG